MYEIEVGAKNFILTKTGSRKKGAQFLANKEAAKLSNLPFIISVSPKLKPFRT